MISKSARKAGCTALLLMALAACTPAHVSPTLTFVTGLNSYHEEMDLLSGRPERWPDRQRLADSIKVAHVAMLGGSVEFNRFVDIDLRRREFLIMLRDQSLNEARAQEMRQELRGMEDQLAALRSALKAQAMRNELAQNPPAAGAEKIATVGLFNLAIDSFAPESRDRERSTQVGPYVVVDDGAMTTVTAPDGETFHCTTKLISEAGAAMTCTSEKPKR
ncbi:MAG TPA: hypothetical protein VIB79_08065 [Candidatus Binatia bacterium]